MEEQPQTQEQIQTEEQAFKASWNLAQQLINNIGELLSASALENAKNEFAQSMSYLKSIRFLIVADLTLNEISALDKIEYGFFLAWTKSRPSGFNETDPKEIMVAYKLHKEYANLLMVALKHYGYLIPPKKDKSAMGG